MTCNIRVYTVCDEVSIIRNERTTQKPFKVALLELLSQGAAVGICRSARHS